MDFPWPKMAARKRRLRRVVFLCCVLIFAGTSFLSAQRRVSEPTQRWAQTSYLDLGTGVTEAALRATPQKLAQGSVAPPSISKFSDMNEYLIMAQLPDGRLMGIWDRTVLDRTTVESIPEAAARYSTDDGYSWSQAEALFKLPKEKGLWAVANILLDRDGELHIFYLDYHTVGEGKDLYDMRYDVWEVRSTDGRKNWKPPNPVWRKGYAGALQSVIQLRNRRILLPLCYLTHRTWGHPGEGFDAFTDVGRFSSSVAYSDDDGDSWHLSPVEFKAPMPYIGADGMLEPVVIQLKDGRVWILIRTPNGRFYESFSQDGAAWSHVQPTRILSSDSPPALVRLKDGRIVMLWNNCLRFAYAQGGRYVIHAAISEDEGRTWRGYREVARAPGANEPHPNSDYGPAYPIPTLTTDQKVIFQTSRVDGKPAYVHIDPAWLYETHRRTDFSAGLDDWTYFGTRGVELTANPDKPDSQVLSLRKPQTDWPAGAVWNFPNGAKGNVRLKLFLKRGFQGVLIGVTDHYSVPFDEEDKIYNLFNLEIGPDGQLANGKRLELGRWHNLQLDWDTAKREGRLSVDGRQIAAGFLSRESDGACYLRLRSTADPTDAAGLLIESVEADVSQSWPN